MLVIAGPDLHRGRRRRSGRQARRLPPSHNLTTLPSLVIRSSAQHFHDFARSRTTKLPSAFIRFSKTLVKSTSDQPELLTKQTEANTAICAINMDPLSVLSIAASVVQFLDFGSRVVQETYNARKNASGTAKARVVTLGKLSGEVTKLAQAIGEKSAGLSHSGHPRSIIEMSLIEQCRRCSEVSGEVLEGVKKLMDRGVKMVDFMSGMHDKECKWSDPTKLGSFRAALRLVWESSKIEELENMMKQIKSDLMFAMITHMWYVSVYSILSSCLTLCLGNSRSQEVTLLTQHNLRRTKPPMHANSWSNNSARLTRRRLSSHSCRNLLSRTYTTKTSRPL